jgi:hypothetical protein
LRPFLLMRVDGMTELVISSVEKLDGGVVSLLERLFDSVIIVGARGVRSLRPAATLNAEHDRNGSSWMRCGWLVSLVDHARGACDVVCYLFATNGEVWALQSLPGGNQAIFSRDRATIGAQKRFTELEQLLYCKLMLLNRSCPPCRRCGMNLGQMYILRPRLKSKYGGKRWGISNG